MAVAELANALVAAGLCIPGKRDKLISWVGREFDLEDGLEPPAHLAGALYLSGLRASATLQARVNHVKINFERGRPVEAKAYLSLERRWHVNISN